MDLNLQDRHLRQRDLVPPERLTACTALVIGVGAIGRQVALQLTAIGVPEMTLIDFDMVDVVNLASQGYTPENVGRFKVEATAESCRRLNLDLRLRTETRRFGRSSPRTLACCDPVQRTAEHQRLVVFCCVDSINTRGIVWEAMKDRAALFVDARISAEVIRVLGSDYPANDNNYPTTLFASERAHVGACTAKSTIYTASIAAGLMVGQFTRWLRGLAIDRDLILNLLASELVTA